MSGGYSPQQLEAMLDELEARKGGSAPAAKVLPFPAMGATADTLGSPAEPASKPIPAAQPAPEPAPAQKPPQAVSAADLLDLAPRAKAGLPSGAKNVKRHLIERDPDTGRISAFVTFDVEDTHDDGPGVQRSAAEQPAGSD